MFKKRISADRENRLPKRSSNSFVREEIRQSDFNCNASDNTALSQSELIRIYSASVRKHGRKNNNEHFVVPDGFGGTLVFKDDEIRSLESELSNLSLQLVLFLNAGLVVSTAFDELLEMNKENENILYRLLRALDKECREKNLSLISELFVFAQKIKSKSLMRFTSLLIDNKTKGSALAEKLDKEREMLQNVRLNTAKAKAKEAETKLCFPLMLLLISLITICSAPALMQL